MSVSHELSHFCSSLTFDDLPREVVQQTKLSILDQVGVSVACPKAFTENYPDISQLAKESAGKKEATILGTRDKLDYMNAVFVNTAFSTATSLDAVHKSSIVHLSGSMIPAAISVAEKNNANGKDLILAIVCGSEIATRVAKALGQENIYALGFHPTCCGGPFGCAVLTSKMLGLSETQLTQAINIAAIQAGGLYLTGGAAVPAANFSLAIAMSSHSGVRSAMLARIGITAFENTFEDERGFLRSHSKHPDQARLTAGLGKEYEIMELCLKPYSVAIYHNTSVEALIGILEKYKINGDDIAEMTLRLPKIVMTIAGSPEYPGNRWRAYTNPRYILAATAYEKSNITYNIKPFGREGLKDPKIMDLYSRINVVADTELDQIYPEQKPCILTIKTKDGRQIEQRNDGPFKGDPLNPLSQGDVERKLMKLAAPVLGQDASSQVIGTVNNLEKLDNVSKLTELLIPKSGYN